MADPECPMCLGDTITLRASVEVCDECAAKIEEAHAGWERRSEKLRNEHPSFGPVHIDSVSEKALRMRQMRDRHWSEVDAKFDKIIELLGEFREFVKGECDGSAASAQAASTTED